MEKNVLNTDLTGKVAVVTGASGTLCSIFAKALARAAAVPLRAQTEQVFAGTRRVHRPAYQLRLRRNAVGHRLHPFVDSGSGRLRFAAAAVDGCLYLAHLS